MTKTIRLEIILELPDDINIDIVKPIVKAKEIETLKEQVNLIPPTDNKKITLSVKELTELIGVSETTVYKMVREKQIPHKKVAGRIVFHRQKIESWLKAEG